MCASVTVLLINRVMWQASVFQVKICLRFISQNNIDQNGINKISYTLRSVGQVDTNNTYRVHVIEKM